ncbi:MAG: metallophosphoesterase [Actinomycetes bacterium]
MTTREDGPARPRDLSETELGFAPHRPVPWLSPGELVNAATKVVVSGLFGSYADKRELQGTFPDPLLACHPGAEELWLDFVADVGDGFDPTYTVAWLLAQDKLDVLTPEGQTTTSTLPPGSLLVMGGDEVYPTASTRLYEDRTKGPYKAALPEAPGGGEPRTLLALPGNHDWYDGLTSFLRVFCQGGRIGGWQTTQPRSYFAVRLPQRWWLLGVDIALGGYVDAPQLAFFRDTVRPLLQAGDGVIVATGKPSWVETGEHDPDAFNTLDFLDRTVVQGTGAQVRLWVSGDSHHYARYAEAGGARQLVTCGIGGAYLSATHALPETLTVPPPEARVRDRSAPVTYHRVATYPDVATSRRLAKRVWGIPWRNPGFKRLCAGVQAALLLVLTGALAWAEQSRPLDALQDAGLSEVLSLAGEVGLIGLVAAVAVGGVAGARMLSPGERGRPHRPLGPMVAPWLLVAVEVLVALVALAALVIVPYGDGTLGLFEALATLAVLAGAAGLVGAQVFAGWLLAFDHVPAYRGWIFSGQGIEDHKGFLRMHIGRDGALTLHPVVVDKICHDWRADPGAEPGAAWVVPSGAVPAARLVEPPVVIAREG